MNKIFYTLTMRIISFPRQIAVGEHIHTHTHIQIHDYIFLMFSHNLVAIMPTRVSENDLSSLISISSLLTTFIWLHCVLYSLIWYSQYAKFTGVQKISHWDLEPNNLFSLLYRERVFFSFTILCKPKLNRTINKNKNLRCKPIFKTQ